MWIENEKNKRNGKARFEMQMEEKAKSGEKEFTTCWFGSSWQGIFS